MLKFTHWANGFTEGERTQGVCLSFTLSRKGIYLEVWTCSQSEPSRLLVCWVSNIDHTITTQNLNSTYATGFLFFGS